MRQIEFRREKWIPLWEQAEMLRERIQEEYQKARKKSFETKEQEQFYGLVCEYAKRQRRIPAPYIRMLFGEKEPIRAVWEFCKEHFAFPCREWQAVDTVLNDMRWYEVICLAA